MRIEFETDLSSAVPRVIIIWPKDSDETLVYCPALEGENAWIEQMSDLEAAEQLAGTLIARTGQSAVLITRDTVDWWMTGLTALR